MDSKSPLENLIASGILAFLTILLFALFARQTSPSHFGTEIQVVIASIFTVAIWDSGNNQYVVRELASGRAKLVDWFNRYSIKAICLAAIVSLACIILARFFSFGLLLSSAIYIIVDFSAQSLAVPIRALQLASYTNWVMSLNRLFSITALLLCSYVFSFEIPLISLLTIGSLFSLLLSCTLLLKLDLWPDTLEYKLINPWKGTGFFSSLSIVVLIQNLDTIVLGAIAGPFYAGIYGAVVRWKNSMSFVSDSFNQVLFRNLSRRTFTFSEMIQLIRNSSIFYLSFVPPIATLILTEYLVNLILSNKYRDSVGVLRIICLAMLPTIVAQILATFLLSRGLEKKVFGVLTISIFLQTSFNILGTFYIQNSPALIFASSFFINQLITVLLLLLICHKLSDGKLFEKYKYGLSTTNLKGN